MGVQKLSRLWEYKYVKPRELQGINHGAWAQTQRFKIRGRHPN
jgi:hypothetical protein